jgi:predicted lipoprotein with Yx(FWY)xxD motif
MKGLWILIVVVLVVGLGYFYRSQIGAIFNGANTAPAGINYGPTGTTAPTASAGAILTWMGTSPSQYGVGTNGMTLYTYDKDTKGVSNCSGVCAGIWPPYTTAAKPATLPANVTLITRADGSMQFAYKGMPLYYYAVDLKAGDKNGDGFGGIWHIIKP